VNENKLTHIDLFSGIGGFSLAAEWAGFKTIVFCEKDEYCQKVLKKHWPEIPIIEEIRNFDGTKYRGATLLTGGFPCQPFSIAGKRKGKEDDRYLWPEMFRVIKEARPHWLLAENVFGIVRMALDDVLSDLESEGYTTGTLIIPACGLNAPHRRNRIWIVANSRCQYGEGSKDRRKLKRQIFKKEDASLPERSNKDDEPRDIKNAQSKRLERGNNREKRLKKKSIRLFPSRPTVNVTDPKSILLQGFDERKGQGKPRREYWEQNWYEVATRFCRVDDGIPNRVDRLKALGNAIVPQIAYEIIRNIAEIEKLV